MYRYASDYANQIDVCLRGPICTSKYTATTIATALVKDPEIEVCESQRDQPDPAFFFNEPVH